MDERRTILRVAYPTHIRYGPAQALLPHEGRLIDLSERGAGFVGGEPYRIGERMTVSVPLPGEDQPLTLTGAVRWSTPHSRLGRQHAVGLEWFPMEETARYRLKTFLNDRAPGVMYASLLRRAGALMVLVGVGMVGWMVASASRENRRLATALEQRHAIIRQLEEQERHSLDEVTRLHHEVQQLEGNFSLLHRTLERMREARAPSGAPGTLASSDSSQ